MIEEIRNAVHDAALGNQKIAMFHFQVLKNEVHKPVRTPTKSK